MDMCPRHVGGRYPTPGSEERAFAALSDLALHADHLAQRVYHVHQIALRFHHRVNGLVRHRSFVDHITPPCQSEPILSKVSSTDKELFRIPGGHIGIMAGSGASKSTWPHIDGWLAPRSKGAISPAAF